MKITHLKSSKKGNDYKLSLYPSSCDFSEDVMQRYLEITEQIPNSVQPFEFKVSKTSPNQYIIHVILSRDILKESILVAELGFLNQSFNIPITFLPSPFLESIDNNLDIVKITISVILGGSYIGALALGTTSVLWSLISFQQFIGYFIYINIAYPFQVELFLQIVESSFWDSLPNLLDIMTSSLSIGFLNPLEVNNEYAPPIKFIRYEKTSFFIENGSSIILTNLILLICLFVILSVKKTEKWKESILLKKLKVNMRWNGIVRTFFENAIPLLLAIFLQLRVLKFNAAYLTICSFLAIISLIYFCSMTYFIVRILYKRDNKLLEYELIKRIYGTLYDGIILTKATTKYYNLIILFRGLVLIFLISFAESTPMLQITPLIFFNAFLVYYMRKEVAFKNQKFYLVAKSKEILILLAEICILFLLVKTENKTHYQIVGWIIVLLLGSAFLIEFIYLVYIQIIDIKEIVKQISCFFKNIILYFKTPKATIKKRIPIEHRLRQNFSNDTSTFELNNNSTLN